MIYDEVHLLPAPVFRATASIQARRRLGLTATLVREDGAEPLVFSLVGPKCYDTAWRELEDAGWIARAECTEVRVALADRSARTTHCPPSESASAVASRNPPRTARRDCSRAIPAAQALVIGHLRRAAGAARRRSSAHR